jgi:hypothetical protein
VLIGAAIGVGGALLASRLLSGVLYSPSVVDPVTFAGVSRGALVSMRR